MIPELSHASYVWTSFAIFGAIVAWQFIQPLLRRKRLINSMMDAEAERAAAEKHERSSA